MQSDEALIQLCFFQAPVGTTTSHAAQKDEEQENARTYTF